ncbi:MAG: hypothetical protein IPH57_03630 [Saprospiraceae bacterium]|nr:hypothetical protein [Saprospiraceae bacterium]
MKKVITLLVLVSVLYLYSCTQICIKYKFEANNKLLFEFDKNDIEFYDTSQVRGYIQIHEIRLKKDFYKDSILILECPVILICEINGKEYFRAKHYTLTQSQPGLGVFYHFDPDCSNKWNFNETDATGAYRGDTFKIFTNNECNSIELFHEKKEIVSHLEDYYNKQEYFRNYTDTARLAHEILF